MAFKMKGYGGFHGKKKPTLFKNAEISTGFEGTRRDPTRAEYEEVEKMEFPQERQDYDGGGLSISYGDGSTTDNEFGTDWTSAPEYTVDKEWQKRSGIKPKKDALQDIKDGKYPEGWKNMSDQEKMDTIFDANMAQAMFHADTNQQKDLTITGGRNYKDTGQGGGRYNKGEDKYEPKWSSTGYSMPNPQTGGAIDYAPNINDILRKEGLATWKDVGEGNVEADFSEYLKRKGEFAMKQPFELENVPVASDGEGNGNNDNSTNTEKGPGPVTGRVGSELRKKQYDERGWRYDDTIKGFNRDGSPKGGGGSNTGAVERGLDSDDIEKSAGGRGKSKGKGKGKDKGGRDKKGRGLNLDLSQINFSDWDRPIREFFGQ